ncbi:hypothetical protein ACQ858_22070 [Variovorax ureilyticus]|uniref:hypothetical protein n=1 Tax=Variovorax ureilyticus TaxID=1836198 RepID=UPI003D67CFF0
MAIWSIGPVVEEPEVELVDWRVYGLRGVYGDSVSRHFAGTCAAEGSGRVSSGIQTFDAARHRGTTRSGRVYELVGRPGWSMNADYVWSAFCRIHPVQEVRDVTFEFAEQAKRETPVGRRTKP